MRFKSIKIKFMQNSKLNKLRFKDNIDVLLEFK